jgi:hypothetical protein
MNVNNTSEVISQFPWLQPTTVDGKRITAQPTKPYTELSFLPKGWRQAFGEQIARDIDALITEANFRDQYAVSQIRVRKGRLQWEPFYVPREIKQRHDEIVKKYADMSEVTCTVCGGPGSIFKSDVWGVPLCADCRSGAGKNGLR